MVKKYKISAERIVSIDGFVRKITELEFWVLPQGAEMPKANQKGAFLDCFCPTVSIENKTGEDKLKTLNFSATVSGSATKKISYEWKTSAGMIVKGQGTAKIKVNLTKSDAEEITVTVKINGCCLEFCAPAMLTTKIQNK